MGLLTKMVVLYLLMALSATLYAPEVIFNDDSAGNLLSWFNIDSYNNETGEIIVPAQVGLNDEISGQFTSEDQTSQQSVFSQIVNGITGLFSYIIDGLSNVMGFIKIIFRVIFSPIILLFNPAAEGMPAIMGLFIGLPLVLLFLFAIVAFIRGVMNP